MTWRSMVKNWDLKLLSLVLAVIVWCGVTGGRTAEVQLTASVEIAPLPPGLSVAGPVPSRVAITVSGPKILLLKLRSERIIIPLDARGAGEGTTLFTGLDQRLKLPRGVTVTRIYPAAIEVRLAPTAAVQKR